MNSVCFVGTVADDDLSRFPEPMVQACGILRLVAHCGQPFGHIDGTLEVYLHLREPADRPMQRAKIRRDGSVQFTAVGGDRSPRAQRPPDLTMALGQSVS
jgi:hypothetical protein